MCLTPRSIRLPGEFKTTFWTREERNVVIALGDTDTTRSAGGASL